MKFITFAHIMDMVTTTFSSVDRDISSNLIALVVSKYYFGVRWVH